MVDIKLTKLIDQLRIGDDVPQCVSDTEVAIYNGMTDTTRHLTWVDNEWVIDA
jgi:hypothetical protein